jgi:hypothetical protein
MKTVDFSGELTASGEIMVPPEIAAQVPRGETLQVVLHWGSSDDDADWHAAGRQQFEAAYGDEDSVYEALIHDAPTGSASTRRLAARCDQRLSFSTRVTVTLWPLRLHHASEFDVEIHDWRETGLNEADRSAVAETLKHVFLWNL